MANLNKVLLIGRLTRDPEVRTFSNGGKVAKFGFAVNNRKKNQQTNQWEDEACFIDVSAFNRESGRQLADLVEQYLHKGNQAFLEGHLVLEQWNDKNDGSKRSVIRLVLDNVQFLEPRADGGTGGGGARFQRGAAAPAARAPMGGPGPESYDEPEMSEMPSPEGPGDNGNIPF